MSKRPKAIFFDAGGTLICPFPSVGAIYAKAACNFGVTCNPETLELEFMKAWKKRGGLASLGEDTNHDKERAWWHSLVKEVFESHGEIPQFDELFSGLHKSFVEKELWQIYPEVPEVISGFKKRGMILGIVSNWDLRLPIVLKNLGLDTSFDFYVSSSECRATKPSEKIFREALNRAGVKPEETVHVGDTYEEDFIGAERSGIRAFHLERNGTTHHAVSKEFRISSLKELLDRVGS